MAGAEEVVELPDFLVALSFQPARELAAGVSPQRPQAASRSAALRRQI